MDKKQELAIQKIYLTDKHPFGRGGLRLIPGLSRWKDDDLITGMDMVRKICHLNIDCFMNVFSADQQASNEYDKIFIDIDDRDLRKAYLKLLAICNQLKKHGITHYLILYSGSKGYHIYIRFKTINIANYRECILGWLRSIKVIQMVDAPAIEPNRVSRIPYTQNSKGAQCVILGNDEMAINPNKIIDCESWDFICNENLHVEIKKYDTMPKPKSKTQEMTTESEIFSKQEYYPDCMSFLINEAKDGVSLGHTERVEMGKFLLHVNGGDVEKVIPIYAKMPDYDSRTTAYQLNYLKRRGMKMMKCESLAENGLCPFKDQSDCVFSPSLNRFLVQ